MKIGIENYFASLSSFEQHFCTLWNFSFSRLYFSLKPLQNRLRRCYFKKKLGKPPKQIFGKREVKCVYEIIVRHRNFNHGQMPWLSLWNISLVLSCRYSTNGADFLLFFGNQGLPNPSVWWVYRSVMVYWSNERPETAKLGCWGGYHKKITIEHFFGTPCR